MRWRHACLLICLRPASFKLNSHIPTFICPELQAIENVAEVLEQILKVQSRIRSNMKKLQNKTDEESKKSLACISSIVHAHNFDDL